MRGFVAEILPQNQRMQRLATAAPGKVTTVRNQDAVHVTILFADDAPTRHGRTATVAAHDLSFFEPDCGPVNEASRRA